jgi:hypothetical protein
MWSAKSDDSGTDGSGAKLGDENELNLALVT